MSVVTDENGDPVEVGDNVELLTPQQQLMIAAQKNDVATVDALLAQGVPINYKNSSGVTVLMTAIIYGCLDVARALVEKGASLEEKSELGKTALMYAAANNRAAFVQYLLDWGADPSVVDSEGQTAAMQAKKYHPDIAEILETQGERREERVLATARRQKQIIHERARQRYKIRLV